LRACHHPSAKTKACPVAILGISEKADTSPALEIAKNTLLTAGLILAVGTITGFMARNIKISDIALFLIVGMAMEPEVFGIDQHKSRFGALSDHSLVRCELHPF
jgi:hypothetical protein